MSTIWVRTLGCGLVNLAHAEEITMRCPDGDGDGWIVAASADHPGSDDYYIALCPRVTRETAQCILDAVWCGMVRGATVLDLSAVDAFAHQALCAEDGGEETVARTLESEGIDRRIEVLS